MKAGQWINRIEGVTTRTNDLFVCFPASASPSAPPAVTNAVVFFCGDISDKCEAMMMGTPDKPASSLANYSIEALTESLAARFPSCLLIAVRPSRRAGPNDQVACFANFVSLSPTDPQAACYSFEGTAASHLLALLSSPALVAEGARVDPDSKLTLVGFSKGGTVINQLLTELEAKRTEENKEKDDDETTGDGGRETAEQHIRVRRRRPVDELFDRTVAIHHVDVGNGRMGEGSFPASRVLPPASNPFAATMPGSLARAPAAAAPPPAAVAPPAAIFGATAGVRRGSLNDSRNSLDVGSAAMRSRSRSRDRSRSRSRGSSAVRCAVSALAHRLERGTLRLYIHGSPWQWHNQFRQLVVSEREWFCLALRNTGVDTETFSIAPGQHSTLRAQLIGRNIQSVEQRSRTDETGSPAGKEAAAAVAVEEERNSNCVRRRGMQRGSNLDEPPLPAVLVIDYFATTQPELQTHFAMLDVFIDLEVTNDMNQI